ncbi:MAG: hypothetical protein IKL30_06380, partial [Anaerotignum sp.]|nr:hypothetical protein [Anaerotignum sp.]
DTVAEFLAQSWNSAGRAKLRVTEIEVGHLHIPELKCQEVRDTVSSLRLDAVAGEAFNLARGKVQTLIGVEKAQVNWNVVTNTSHQLKEGDLVSLRGFGRFRIKEIGGKTKKDRTGLEIEKYI